MLSPKENARLFHRLQLTQEKMAKRQAAGRPIKHWPTLDDIAKSLPPSTAPKQPIQRWQIIDAWLPYEEHDGESAHDLKPLETSYDPHQSKREVKARPVIVLDVEWYNALHQRLDHKQPGALPELVVAPIYHHRPPQYDRRTGEQLVSKERYPYPVQANKAAGLEPGYQSDIRYQQRNITTADLNLLSPRGHLPEPFIKDFSRKQRQYYQQTADELVAQHRLPAPVKIAPTPTSQDDLDLEL